MAAKVYVCDICNFAYNEKATAKKCESWCRENKSCNLEITKSSIGELTIK